VSPSDQALDSILLFKCVFVIFPEDWPLLSIYAELVFFFGERYDGRVQFLKPDALLKFLDYGNPLLFVSYGEEMNEAIFLVYSN